MDLNKELVTIDEAINLATAWSGKTITLSNISYLFQYGRLIKYNFNGKPFIKKDELKSYYKSSINLKKKEWKKKLGKDLSWNLSFYEYKERETTKHIHRLHPYKGKFIPQLVEYFLDSNKDNFKKNVYFKKGDLVIDPFCGSGTTLVQSNELGINCLGIDVSVFNTLISNVKLKKYNLDAIKSQLKSLTKKLEFFNKNNKIESFSKELSISLSRFNKKHFPSPQFKIAVLKKKIDDKAYGKEKEKEFLKNFQYLSQKYSIKFKKDEKEKSFINKWFLSHIKMEFNFLSKEIEEIKDKNIQNLVMVILSRTIRSCRATTHSDLGTLKKIVTQSYYCKKHSKICTPITSIEKRWKQYCKDSIKRIEEFDNLQTNTQQYVLCGDSRTIDIFKSLKREHKPIYKLLKNKKAKGIFTSPPYVGLIDYHEQHAYSYELFKLKRRDNLEIGPLSKGQGKEAQNSYVKNIAQTLMNCKRIMVKDFDIFLVANDKYNLYPIIAEEAGLKIKQTYKRPVLNRIEKNRSAYSEFIFHMKNKD